MVLDHLVNRACIDRVAGFRREPPSTRNCGSWAPRKYEGPPRPASRHAGHAGAVPERTRPSPSTTRRAGLHLGHRIGRPRGTGDGGHGGRLAEGAAAILAGKLHSTSAQFPREIGRLAAEKAYEHLAGKAVDKKIKCL